MSDKPAGWFSRRYQSSTNHDAARLAHTTKSDRQGVAQANTDERNKRGASAQLEELDRRLGAGLGAKRERAALQLQLA